MSKIRFIVWLCIALAVVGFCIALSSSALMFWDVIESGVAWIFVIVGIGLMGAGAVAYMGARGS